MLSALIPSEHSYPAFALGRTAGTPEVRLSWSSRTEESFPSGILTPTSDRDRQLCYSLLGRGTGHFCPSLHIAMQFGLYLHPFLRISGVQSLKIPNKIANHLILTFDTYR